MEQTSKRPKGNDGKPTFQQGTIMINVQHALTALPVPDYEKLFTYSPIGVGCIQCRKAIPIDSNTKRNVKRHVKKHNYTMCFDEWLADYEYRKAKMTKEPLCNYVRNTKLGYVCVCNTAFRTWHQANQHTSDPLGACTEADMHFAKPIWELTSFHIVPVTDSPVNLVVRDFDYARERVKPYIREDEDLEVWSQLLAPVVFEYKSFTNDLILKHISYMTPQQDHDDLHHLLETASTWLLRDARSQVGLIPGNYRAALMVFEGAEINDVKQNNVYTFRHKPEMLVPVLHKLLCYAYHLGFITLGNTAEYTSDTVPRMLCNILLESSQNFTLHTIAIKFCLFRGFHVSSKGITMNACNTVSKVMAAVMSLLRAAVCAHCCSFAVNADAKTSELVQNVRACRTMNMLAPYIRWLRNMDDDKPQSMVLSTTNEGTVFVNQFEVKYSLWSASITRSLEIIRKLLDEIVDGDWHVPFLSTRTRINVSIDTINEDLCVEDLTPVFVDQIDAHMFERLMAHIQLGCHGFAGGSMRGTEVEDLSIKDFHWHNNTLYFFSQVHKQGNLFAQYRKKTERKLPAEFARVFIVFRLCMQIMHPSNSTVFPFLKKQKFTMCHAAAELWNFGDNIPTLLELRHLWTSYTNLMFFGMYQGEPTDIISCADDVAELHGHSKFTHKAKYSSKMLEGLEAIYCRYHESLGYSEIPVDVDTTYMTKVNISRAITTIFGPKATFQTYAQEQMLEWCCLPKSTHCVTRARCGSGKSCSWLIPTIMRHQAKLPVKTIIVVEPYKYLAQHQIGSMQQQIPSTVKGIKSDLCTGADVMDNTFVPKYTSTGALPHVLFVTLEALVYMVQKHKAIMMHWMSLKLLDCIIIDEAHTIFNEQFRSVYDQLPFIATLGLPVMIMSGTLQASFFTPLLQYMHLQKEGENTVTQINDNVLIGTFPTKFEFRVIATNNLGSSVIKQVDLLLKANRNNIIHIFVTNVLFGKQLEASIKRNYTKCEFVSADLPLNMQSDIATKWRQGKLNVLISTTVALVGTECNQCHHLIMAGLLFNLVSLVQAMNRLRPKQRKPNGSITVYMHPVQDTAIAKYAHDDEDLFKKLKAKQIVKDDWNAFNKIFTFDSIHAWAVSTEVCRVQFIYNRFDLTAEPCNICDRCMQRPLAVSKRQAEQAKAAHITNLQHATHVLSTLKRRCLWCHNPDCMGLAQNSCSRSHTCMNCNAADHLYPKCKLGLRSIFHENACYKCWMYKHVAGAEYHDTQSCPVKYRLRRLIFQDAKRQHKTVQELLTEIYASEITYVDWLAKMSKQMQR